MIIRDHAGNRAIGRVELGNMNVNIKYDKLFSIFEKMMGVETTVSSSSAAAATTSTSPSGGPSGSTNKWKVTGLNISFSGFLEGVDEKKSTAAAVTIL